MIVCEDYEAESIRVVTVFKNGFDDISNCAQLRVVPQMTMLMVQQQLQQSVLAKRIRVTCMRVFTEQGVELYEDDLQFLRDGQIVYASMNGCSTITIYLGEDFDQSSGLAHYQMLSLLGQGGFGKVLLAQHRGSKQKVAIKIVNTASIGNAEDIDMVFREAEMLKSLVHHNIVKIYNCFTLTNMQVVYVMEYLEGGELLDYVQKQTRIPESDARIFFLQIADAIQYCHHQKLIHRDLKLENILLADKESKKVKIVDFGIAGMATNLDVSKIGAGSLKYMAPELFTHKLKKIGPHIDIWALGVILYGLVFGQLPFDGPNQASVIDSILSQDYSFPSSVPISLELKHLINELFNPDHLHRIRMSEIMLHPWCCNETHDMGRKNEIKKPLHRSVVTLSVGREFSKIAANKLSGGPSKLGNLMAGPSKLGNLGKLNAGLSTLRVSNIDQIMKLSLPDSPNKELSAQKSALKNSSRTDWMASPKEPVVPEQFKALVDRVIPSLVNVQEEEDKSPTSPFKPNLPPPEQSPPQKRRCASVTKNYSVVLDRFKSETNVSNFSLVKLKKTIRENFPLLFPESRNASPNPKSSQKFRLMKTVHATEQYSPLPRMRQSLPSLFAVEQTKSKKHGSQHQSPSLKIIGWDEKRLNQCRIGFYKRVSFQPPIKLNKNHR